MHVHRKVVSLKWLSKICVCGFGLRHDRSQLGLRGSFDAENGCMFTQPRVRVHVHMCLCWIRCASKRDGASARSRILYWDEYNWSKRLCAVLVKRSLRCLVYARIERVARSYLCLPVQLLFRQKFFARWRLRIQMCLSASPYLLGICLLGLKSSVLSVRRRGLTPSHRLPQSIV